MTDRRTAVTASVTIAIAVAIYFFRIDGYAGLLLDDAWYMVLGKSFADGEGFRLVSSSATAIVPAVPPGFPFLLSIVFWVSPSYPGNLLLLKAVSLIAMAGVGAACWIDFTRNRNVPPAQAVWLVAAIVLTPAFVFLATSTVMAECVFTLAQMLTVIAVERVIRRQSIDGRAAAIAGIVAGATLLIRTAGLAVVAASLAYFILHRQWRHAAIFAATVAICMLPWQLYARANAPTFEERVAHGGTISYTYAQLLAMERPGAFNTQVSPVRMVLRAGRNAFDIATRDVGAVILPVLYRGPSESGEEVISVGRPGRGSMGGATGTMIVSALLCLIVIAGIARTRAWFSLPAMLIAASLVVMSPVAAQTYRYVVPLAPFLLLFLWRGIAHQAASRIAVLCVLGFHVIDHGMFLAVKATTAPVWIADAREVEDMLTWMTTNLTEEGPVVSSNPGLLYLWTGRKGVVMAFPNENWEKWKQARIPYAAALRPTQMPEVVAEPHFLYQTKGRRWIVKM